MIAPDVEIVDLEPKEFARICVLAAQAQARPERTVSVLHDCGTVVVAHDSGGGEVDARVREPFTDARRRAGELREITGADRVVLYDRARTDALGVRLVENASPHVTQLEAFWTNHRTFWSSDAIAVDPQPAASAWACLPERIDPLGDDWWALLALYEGDACVATLLGHVTGGRVDVVTSLDHLGTTTTRPRRAAAVELLELVRPLGRAELVLVCDEERFGAALQAPDPLAAVAAIAEDGHAIVERNVRLLAGRP